MMKQSRGSETKVDEYYKIVLTGLRRIPRGLGLSRVAISRASQKVQNNVFHSKLILNAKYSVQREKRRRNRQP